MFIVNQMEILISLSLQTITTNQKQVKCLKNESNVNLRKTKYEMQ